MGKFEFRSALLAIFRSGEHGVVAAQNLIGGVAVQFLSPGSPAHDSALRVERVDGVLVGVFSSDAVFFDFGVQAPAHGHGVAGVAAKEGPQHDVHGKLAALGIAGSQIHARVHGPRPGILRVIADVPLMKVPHGFGQQQPNRLALKFLAGVAEAGEQGSVGAGYVPLRVNDRQHVRVSFKERQEHARRFPGGQQFVIEPAACLDRFHFPISAVARAAWFSP